MEMWPAPARHEAAAELRRHQPTIVFGERRKFWLKTLLLLATTVAVVPIIALKAAGAAGLYLGFLVVVHLAGLAVFAWGVGRKHFAPSTKGLVVRLVGLAIVIVLLAWVAKGLSGGLSSALFWLSLAGIWLLHTGGLLLMHVRTPGEAIACPFID